MLLVFRHLVIKDIWHFTNKFMSYFYIETHCIVHTNPVRFGPVLVRFVAHFRHWKTKMCKTSIIYHLKFYVALRLTIIVTHIPLTITHYVTTSLTTHYVILFILRMSHMLRKLFGGGWERSPYGTARGRGTVSWARPRADIHLGP